MQNGNPVATVFYACALSLWERVGGGYQALNLDLGP